MWNPDLSKAPMGVEILAWSGGTWWAAYLQVDGWWWEGELQGEPYAWMVPPDLYEDDSFDCGRVTVAEYKEGHSSDYDWYPCKGYAETGLPVIDKIPMDATHMRPALKE